MNTVISVFSGWGAEEGRDGILTTFVVLEAAHSDARTTFRITSNDVDLCGREGFDEPGNPVYLAFDKQAV